MKILLVENHREFTSVVIPAFLSEHDVTVVTSCAAAREVLSGGSFDAVLVDYDLDDAKGTRWFAGLHRRRHLRSSRSPRTTPATRRSPAPEPRSRARRLTSIRSAASWTGFSVGRAGETRHVDVERAILAVDWDRLARDDDD
jgi:hypothetical protein